MKIRILVALCCYFITMPSFLRAQWTRTDGPSGGFVTSMQSNDEYIFAGTNNGIYRSADNGFQWERLENGLPFSILCYDLDLQDDRLIFFGWDHIANWGPGYNYKVFKSTNNGEAWEKIEIPDTVHIPEPLQLAIRDSMIFLASKSLLRSTDNGQTWTTLLSLQDSFYYSCAQLEIYDDRLFVVGHYHLWMTEDWGSSWYKTKLPSGCNGYNVYPMDSLFILACEDDAYRSLDYGATWQKATGWLFANPNDKDIYFHHDTFYTNSSNMLRSVDFGVSWEIVPPESNGFFPYGLTIHQGKVFGCSLSNGIQQFWPPSDFAQLRYTGIDATSIQSLEIHDNELWAGVYYNGLFRYDLDAQTWDTTNYFPDQFGVVDIAWIGDSVFIANYFGEVFRSADLGLSWKKIYDGTTNIAEFLVDGSVLYLINDYDETTATSTDLGDTWQPPFPGFYKETNEYPGSLVALQEDYFMSVLPDRFFHSENGGASWEELNTGIALHDGFIQKLHSTGPYLVMETYVLAFDEFSLTLYVSLDNGVTWSNFMDGIPPIATSDPVSSPDLDFVFYMGTLMMATESEGVYFRTAQDLSWQPFMVEDKFPRYATTLALTDKKLFVGTSGMGVWQTDVDNFPVVVDVIDDPAIHMLISPNPATSTISFLVKTGTGNGELSLFNTAGQLILKKHIESVSTFSIFISDLAVGVYTVRLETADQVFISSFVKQ